MSTTSAIRFDNVTLGYDRRPAVHHLTGTLARGSLTAVVGPNGAGKSTLLKAIAGALPPLEGRISTEAPIAYLPQAAALDREFPLSVHDLVSSGLWRRHGMFGGVSRADRHTIAEAIAAVGLTGFEDRPIGTLSGGQMQRMLFARLMLQDASVILLDEPLTAIDTKSAADLIALVQRWHRDGRTIMAVLHDLDLVKQVFPETLLIAREVIAWGPTETVLTAENLLAARRMIEAHDASPHLCHRAA
jgi:zinc/manganese transport system ATP-binding protein